MLAELGIVVPLLRFFSSLHYDITHSQLGVFMRCSHSHFYKLETNITIKSCYGLFRTDYGFFHYTFLVVRIINREATILNLCVHSQ